MKSLEEITSWYPKLFTNIYKINPLYLFSLGAQCAWGWGFSL